MSTRYMTCTLAIAWVATALLAMPALAAEQEYKPKAKVTPLVETAVPGMDGRKVVIKHFVLPPGYEGGRHVHTGPVFVYVLDGALTVDVEGMERQTAKAGEVYQEPIGRVMQGRNLNASSPAEIVVFQIAEAGKPMMLKAD